MSLAQQPNSDSLATKMGRALLQAHVTKVVVFDFTGPGKGVTQLGVSFANQLSSDLACASKDYSVVSRSEWMETLQKEKMDPSNPWDAASSEAARWIAGETGASAFVIGTIKDNSKGIRISVGSYQVSKAEPIFDFGVTLPKTPEREGLMAVSVQSISTAIPTSGNGGYGIPQCKSCPVPRFPPYVVRLKGKKDYVRLKAVITTEGEARDIRVVQDPGNGMTSVFIQAVSKWQFTPANGPDGKPAAVQTLLEVELKRSS